jgi:hypothetical protein
MTGSAVGADQSLIHDVGTCLAYYNHPDGSVAWIIEDCAQPHEMEVTGAYDVSGESSPPTEDTWWSVVGPGCQAAAESYVGGPLDEANGVHADAIYLQPGSWDAGSRRGNCVLAISDSDGIRLTTTGSLRG